MNLIRIFFVMAFCVTSQLSIAQVAQEDETKLLDGTKRIVFLGDSITFSGQYVAQAEFLLQEFLLEEKIGDIEFLNLGLPSETVSGLSEPGHAGGRFPRPDLAERLERVLEQIKPDLVIANYGMNCGIYHPYSDDRFAAFRNGMKNLHDKVIESGAEIVHITPPAFDPNPNRERLEPAGAENYRAGYVGYDEVLHLYSAWLLAMRGEGWHVIDAHSSIIDYVESKRDSDPDFSLSRDGVHINDQGHFLIARQLVGFLNRDNQLAATELSQLTESLDEPSTKRFKLIERRQQILRDAWLTSIGHERPGMQKGLSIDAANASAEKISQQLKDLVSKNP